MVHALHVHNYISFDDYVGFVFAHLSTYRKAKHPVCCAEPLDAISMDEALECRRKDTGVMQVEATIVCMLLPAPAGRPSLGVTGGRSIIRIAHHP